MLPKTNFASLNKSFESVSEVAHQDAVSSIIPSPPRAPPLEDEDSDSNAGAVQDGRLQQTSTLPQSTNPPSNDRHPVHRDEAVDDDVFDISTDDPSDSDQPNDMSSDDGLPMPQPMESEDELSDEVAEPYLCFTKKREMESVA